MTAVDEAVRGDNLLSVTSTFYETLAPFYDSVVGDGREIAQITRKLIAERRPRAKTVLELACGTGSVLKHLSKRYDVTGLDASASMLTIARDKLPEVPLFQQDMVDFDLGGQRFDAVICVFDSLNHVLTLDDWRRLFSRAHSHLNDGGVIVFDINTESKLKDLATGPSFVHEFDDNLMIMGVSPGRRGTFLWNLKVFEQVAGGLYRLHQDSVPERSFPAALIRKVLFEKFKKVEVRDFESGRVSPRSRRLHFVAEKR